MTIPLRNWQPHVTVATVVPQAERLLMVEEWINGAKVFNQPAGHLEADENLIEAAIRETREETAWEVRPTALIGVYHWTTDSGITFIRFAFAADPIDHYLSQPLDEGILRALWMTPRELEETASRHRSPQVARVVADYLDGRRLPLDALHYWS
ncbi:MAG: NUDIX hydrolase [Xanthomonadaceae bacterium]|nr:NUDIX hydrolase [Xanthomonadaceae bacterium]